MSYVACNLYRDLKHQRRCHSARHWFGTLEEETTAESIELHKYVQMVVRHAAEGPIKTRGGTQGTRQKTGFARFKDIVLSFVFISNGEFCMNCTLVYYRFCPRCCSDPQESRHRMEAALVALLFASVPVPLKSKSWTALEGQRGPMSQIHGMPTFFQHFYYKTKVILTLLTFLTRSPK